jgi:hypothetical protein
MDVSRFTPAELSAHLVAGDLKLAELRPAIQEWLAHENNRLLPEASVVYRAWLNATRDTRSIEKALAEWVAVNGCGDDGEHLFRAWLHSRGRFVVIRKQFFEWVRAHSLERDAGYLLKSVVHQRVLPDDVTLKVLKWCADFADDPDAIWRLNSLSAHISSDLFEEAVRASASTLDPLFANPDLSGVTRSQVTTILGNLAKLEDFGAHPQSRELDALLCRWMNHPQSFEPSIRHAPYHQNRQFLTRLLAAAESETPTPELSTLLEWLGFWDGQARVRCKDLVKQVRALRHTATAGRRQRG